MSRLAVPPMRACSCGRSFRAWREHGRCPVCVAETRVAIASAPLGLREIQRARQAEREARYRNEA